ncbi:T-cell surface glycoprotein CD8 alpha chain [Phalacrocorax aristotelis]|uniref:T-cell surface glycoprotein CD8 alpha chain n=1 Tax=Phalacrocorax aristotelis TaxID=126867 RepID=UPI003F4C81E2
MAGSPALRFLLALWLCCPGTWNQMYQMTVRLHNSKLQAGQQLKLECETNKDDSGVFWVRLDKNGTLHFIVFISSLSRTTFEGNKKTSTRFEAKKESKFYWLVVKSFTSQDEGKYFCLMNINQILYFSPGQPAFLPVATKAAPATPAPTTQHGITEKDPCTKTPDPESSKEEDMNLFCNIFIWVPLAGACILLLIALAVTVVLCQQTRRRRCRCKRPVNGKPNVKPSVPSRHV